MSLRLRLTFLCVALVVIVLGGFAAATYLRARTRIYASFDDSLTSEANAIVAILPPGAPDEQSMQAAHQALDTEAAAGSLFQIRDANGNTLYSSFRGSPNLSPRTGGPGPVFTHKKVGQEELRILSLPIRADSPAGGSIEVARPTREVDEALFEIRNTLIAGSVIALVLTFFPAYFIAGRALKPVHEVSKLARRIERTSDFSQRLLEPRTSDEIGELTTTFNQLIARIEQTLAAHSRFLAESSHELRRPLTILRTNLDILRDPALPAADRAACLERMSHEARAMSSLVGDLLLLNRDRTLALQSARLDFSRLCAEEAGRIALDEQDLPVLSGIEPGLFVDGDEQRLRQLVKNLLENAVNYSPGGSPVHLRLSNAGGRARLTVEDRGMGIAPEDLPHVFDRFYRGSSAAAAHSEGVGLGLAIVKYVAEGHNGSVDVCSQPGAGTVFTVELPLAVVSREPLAVS